MMDSMWCTLNQFALIEEDLVNRIDSFLGEEVPVREKAEQASRVVANKDDDDDGEQEDAEREIGVDRWYDDMEVDSSERSDADGASKRENSKWLRSTLVGASNTLETLAFAHVNRIVVLERSSKVGQKYEISARIHVAQNLKESEYITALHVLPVATTRKTETNVSDWTCIIVALSNGVVNFYSERGTLIFYERVAKGFISAIRFGRSSLSGHQELVFLSQSRLTVIEGHLLFTNLRHARSQIAKGDKPLEELATTLPLKSHVLRIDRLSHVFDFTIIGPRNPSVFEQYATASRSEAGTNARIRTGMPTYGTYFCLAKDVFGAFVWHNYFDKIYTPMDVVNTFASEMVSNVASYVPSIGFRSFLGIGTSRKDQPTKKSAVDATVETAYVRQMLNDAGRVGDRLFVAPSPWRLLAVADQSARVLVIDTDSRRVVRLFKGYRNARCAFVETTGKVPGFRRPARALFLVIFAPKRGLLEVWSMQNGPRVSAFNVDPRGRLISLPSTRDGLLGEPADENACFRQASHTVAFINSDGQVFFIVAPFRLAAVGSSESALHDESLFKDFRMETVLGEDDLDMDKAFVYVQTLRTPAYRRKCFELFLRSSRVRPITVAKVITRLLAANEEQDSDAKNSMSEFTSFLETANRILKLYQLLRNHKPATLVEEPEACAKALKFGENEVEFLHLDLLKEITDSRPMDCPTFPTLRTFTEQFNLDSASPTTTPTSSSQTDLSDGLKFVPKDEKGKIAVLGAIFAPFVFGDVDVAELLQEVAPLFGMSLDTLIEYLCTFWLSDLNKRPIAFASKLTVILKATKSALTSQVMGRIEELVRQTENVQAGFFFLASVLSLQRWEAADQGVPPDVDAGVDAFDVDDQWEEMNENTEYCELLARHHAVLALLDGLPPPPQLSLKNFGEKGAGYYREQFGAWSANSTLPIDTIMDVVEKKEVQEPSLNTRLLSATFKHLPFSLRKDLMLSDCAWECASAWFRDDTRRVLKLSRAIAFLEHLECPRLKHGLCLMIWDTFLRQPFERLYKFMNINQGRRPQDRDSRRELFITEADQEEFLTCVETLLRLLMKAVGKLPNEPFATLQYEGFVEQFVQQERRRRPTRADNTTLADMAGRQKAVNYHLIMHHQQLAVSMKLLISCSIQMLPKLAFDSIGHRAFFEPLQSHPLIPLARVEEVVKRRRQKFLEEVVEQLTTVKQDQSYDQWLLVLEIGEQWKLDVDALRTKEVVLLYELGQDRDAERHLNIIIDEKRLAFALFPVMIGRIRYFLRRNKPLYDVIMRRQIASLSTMDYVKSIPESAIPTFDVSATRTRTMLRSVRTMLQRCSYPEVAAKLRVLEDLISVIELILKQ